MKSRTLVISFFSFVTIALMGCLQSPILDHADAASKPSPLPTVEENAVCRIAFQKEKICASLTWVKMPTADDQGEFTLRFWSQELATESGPYLDPGYTVFVKLFMPSMGHGSSPVKTTQAQDASGVTVPGVFSVTDVYFVMPGAWQIIIQFRKGSQVVDQAFYNVQI